MLIEFYFCSLSACSGLSCLLPWIFVLGISALRKKNNYQGPNPFLLSPTTESDAWQRAAFLQVTQCIPQVAQIRYPESTISGVAGKSTGRKKNSTGCRGELGESHQELSEEAQKEVVCPLGLWPGHGDTSWRAFVKCKGSLVLPDGLGFMAELGWWCLRNGTCLDHDLWVTVASPNWMGAAMWRLISLFWD